MKGFKELLDEKKWKPLHDFCQKYKLSFHHLKPLLPLGKPTQDNIIKASMFLMFLEDLPLDSSAKEELLKVLDEAGCSETLKMARTLNNITKNMKIEGLEDFNIS